MAQADLGAQKLGAIFKPMLDELKREIREHNTMTSQEILLAMARLEAKIDVLEKLTSEKRKPAGPKATKAADGEVEVAAIAPKNFPTNKLLFFRDQYKSDATYRAKYVTPEIQALFDADAVISGKANEAQKLTAQATFCWNYFKKEKPEIFNAIDAEFTAAKQVHEAAAKPVQQVADADTPTK